MTSNGLLDRRAVLVGLAGGATGVAGFTLSPANSVVRKGAPSLEQGIPQNIGPWRNIGANSVVVARPDEEVQQPDLDGYDQLVARTYTANNLPSVMMVLAYGSAQGGNLQLHRPETCYPGQGFQLSNFAAMTFVTPEGTTVFGKGFTARRDQRVERVRYWTRIGDDFPQNTFSEYRAILKAVFKGSVSDGLLARFSIIGDEQIADATLDRFLKQLIETLSRPMHELLLGSH